MSTPLQLLFEKDVGVHRGSAALEGQAGCPPVGTQPSVNAFFGAPRRKLRATQASHTPATELRFRM